VGRTGVLTPVAQLAPVKIKGTLVKNATLHNLDQIKRLAVRLGDTVVVHKAGEIIPAVIKVLPNLRPANARSIKPPTRCPVCRSAVIIKKPAGQKATFIYCPNSACFAQHKEKLVHFVSKKAFNIEGLGDKIIGKLLKTGLIKNQADIFTLKKDDLLKLAGFADKKADNLLFAIHQAKQTTLPKFLYSLGIKNLGAETALVLANKLVEIKQALAPKEDILKWLKKYMANLKTEDLQEIHDIGPVGAKSIADWFKAKDNQKLLNQLFENRVKIIRPKAFVLAKDKLLLAGKIFVFTGELSVLTREQAQGKVREQGGRSSSSVSNKTDYLVAGKNPGSKLAKARSLGVKVIGEKEFLRMVK